MKRATLSFVIALTLLFSGAKAQWHSMDGPQGRYVRSILCTDSLYYAATGGGVLVSSDQGLNWEFRNDGLTSCDTKCLVTYNDTVFLATDENIFRSTDGGLHWTPDPYLHNHYIKHLLVHNGSLLASTYIQGVYQSTEGTQGEYTSDAFPSDVRYPYFMADNDDAMFIATYKRGVYRSFDNGASWGPCSNGLNSDVLGIYCHNGKVFATVLGQGVMASSNNGDTWTSANLNKQAKGYAHLGDTLYAACIGQGVFASFDNGITWHDFNTNLESKNLWCMDAHDGHLFVGDTQGRIYRGNSDGTGWIRTNTPSFLATVGNIGVSGGRVLAATHGSDMFYTDDGTSSSAPTCWAVSSPPTVAPRSTRQEADCPKPNGSRAWCAAIHESLQEARTGCTSPSVWANNGTCPPACHTKSTSSTSPGTAASCITSPTMACCATAAS